MADILNQPRAAQTTEQKTQIVGAHDEPDRAGGKSLADAAYRQQRRIQAAAKQQQSCAQQQGGDGKDEGPHRV